MKAFVLFILLCIGGRAVAQTPNIILQYGVIDNSSYLSTSVAAATYAPIDSIQIYTSGTTITVNNKVTWLIINPSSVVAALTVTMPASPYDKQVVKLSFGKIITSGQPVVTLITVAPNTGQTLLQPLGLDQVVAGESLTYKYVLSLTNWYRQ